jgi:hypothetical protein
MSHPPSLLHPFSIPSPSLLHPSSLQNLVRKGGAWQLVHVFHSSPCRAGSLAAMP